MTTTQDSPPAGTPGASDDDPRGHDNSPADAAAGNENATESGTETETHPPHATRAGQEIPDPYRLDHAAEARAQAIFDQQLTTLTDTEHQKSLLAHREIIALVTAHRHAYALLPAGTRPGAPRPHAPGSTDRGDTWLQARELVLSEYAPACSLSTRTAGHRFDQALDASQFFPDTLTALTDPHSGITPQKLSILLRETQNLTLAQKRAVEAIVLPHAAEDTSTAWARRIREAIVTVLGAPLAAKVRRRREEDRYIAVIPDGMIAHLLGELPLAQARALDLALDALADTAAPDDPRTRAQRRIDALIACVLGPAVFLTRPAGTKDNHGTGGGPGSASDGPVDPDALARPAPRDEDEPVPDYGHGQPDPRDIGRHEAGHERFIHHRTAGKKNAESGADQAGTVAPDPDGTTKAEAEAEGVEVEVVDLDADELNPYHGLPLPVFGDWDEPQPDPHQPEDNGDDPLTRALWDTGSDGDSVFALIDPHEAARVTEVWDLIRQLASQINLTIPAPPVVHLDVTIPVDLLAGSDRASPTTNTDHASGRGRSLPPGPSINDQPPGPRDRDARPPNGTGSASRPPDGIGTGRPRGEIGSGIGCDQSCADTGDATDQAGCGSCGDTASSHTHPADASASGSDCASGSGASDSGGDSGSGSNRTTGSDQSCPDTDRTGWRTSDLFDVRHAAIIDGIGPVDPDLARHLAADARWRRVLADPVTGIVYDVGKTRYRIPADMRRRVTTRDVTCRFPGCARRARYCHLDHVIEYPNVPTADTNLIALCELHHRVKHQTGWQLILHEDASIDWTSPTGRKYTTYPPGRKAPPRQAKPKKKTG